MVLNNNYYPEHLQSLVAFQSATLDKFMFDVLTSQSNVKLILKVAECQEAWELCYCSKVTWNLSRLVIRVRRLS